MRQFVARTFGVVSLLLVFCVPASLFGQDQNTKKPDRSSAKKHIKEITLKADPGPAIKVPTPIKKDRRTPSARHDADQDQGDTKPVEPTAFRVMTHPREDRLVRGRAFHGDLRTLTQVPPVKFERPEFEEPTRTPVIYPGTTSGPAPGPAVPSASPTMNPPAPSASASFDGLDFLTWGAGHPPDTNGDAGPTYFIQTINTSIGIFRKSDGVRVAAFTFNSFFNGHFGNLCDTNNFGDPVVLYDTFEDRWIITDFAFLAPGGVISAPTYQCFAVSQSGDPVSGGWNFYSIQTAATSADAFDDYPKFGLWSDGLYMSANMFNITGSAFRNVRVWAFNKTEMYAGAPTIQIVSFDAPSAEFTLLPSNSRLQTGTPPSGTPNYFASVFNFLNVVTVYKFHVDWTNPPASTFTGPFQVLSPTSWSQFTGASGRVPTPANAVDSLYPRLMVQNQYSNIGGAESLWDSHTVGASGATSAQAAVRYYQVDVTAGTVAANTSQAFTYSPETTIHRFMPSVDVDRAGDMAMGYSATNATLNPAIRYAGRLAGDPVNSITQDEQSLVEGTTSQNVTNRWGDYSAMSLDPDGCTFWYTNMYYAGVSPSGNFSTRIGAFAFPSCTPVGAGGAISGTVTAAGTGNPIQGVTVALGARITTTDINGGYSFPALPSGTYPSVTATLPGFVTGTSVNVLVSDGLTTTVNFSLIAAPTNGCFVDTSQADFQAGTATNCDLITSPGDVKLRSGPGIDQQNTTLGNFGVGITITTWGGQTFTPSATGLLTRADINLFCSGCTGTTPNLTLSLRATSGGLPTGADLASATITGFSSGAAVFYTATFSSPPTLTAGTQYALVIRPTANPAPGTYALTRSGAQTVGADVYAGGTRVSGATSGTVWSIPLTGGVSTDAGFKVFIDSGFAAAGTFTSSLKDANPAADAITNWGALSWNASTPPNTSLKFQAAASNSPFGPFNFVGPDGTAGTFFNSGDSLAQFNSFRYLKYQAALSSTDNTQTPTLNDVSICFTDVHVVSAPSINKSFGAATIPLNGTTSLTFNITNNDAITVLTGLAFTDNLPSGLVVSSTPNLANSCGGAATAAGGSSSVSLSGGTLAASASCTVSVDVQGTTASVKNNSVQVTSTEGGTGNTSNAILTVVAPPVIIKAFGAAGIPLNGSTSLTFTIQNNNTIGLTGVAFTDTLPAGLVVATPNNLTGSCGGNAVITATQNTNAISLSNGSIPASSSCNFQVDVTGIAAGPENNTTGNVTSTEGGTGGTASASINVEAPPSIAKVFNPNTISLNATTSLTFTITNPAANVDALTGLAFSDTLPTGLTVANASVVVCGGTLTTAAPTGIALSGATINTNSQCQFSVTVTGAASGLFTNTTGNVTSTNGGTGNTASSSLTVASAPAITKAFGAATIPLNGATSLTFHITNPNTTLGLTGVAFTDSLPSGLVVASTPNLTGTCGGTATAAAGASSVSLSAGALASSAGCDISVSIQGTTGGVMNNSVQVTSTEGGTGNTSNASITVGTPPVIIKAFGAASIPLNGTTSLTFTIQNNNATQGLSGVGFSDTLPAGLIVSTPNGLTGSCGGGTITATQNTNIISLTGATIATSSSCTFSVNVTGAAAGLENNTTGNVTSTEGGTGGTASASIKVEGPPSIAKVFNPNKIAPTTTTSLAFTITNPGANVDALTGVAFTDTLPTGLTVPNASATVCGGTLTLTAQAGIALSGATINANSQCQFSVTVTGATAGNYTNTTGNVTSTNGGTGNTASASLTVQPADLTITKTHTGNFNRGQTGTYTITVTNSGIGPTNGTVTVVDTLPAVANTFVPTVLSGSGWTCTLATVTCTRSDALAPGASYPAITLTVNVPSNIQANLTNTATVSGGGETNTGNDTASDPTHIGPPIQITPGNGSATVPAGQAANYSLTVDSSPGLGSISFSCSGLPAFSTCTFNPPSESQLTATVTMTVTTTASSSASLPGLPGGTSTYAFLFPMLGLAGIVFAGKRNKMRRRLVLAFSGFTLFVALAGCGGHPKTNVGTPPGTYTITVTGTGTSASATSTVTLSVL